MEDQQLWGSDAEWESGTVLCELKATSGFSSNSDPRPFLFMKPPRYLSQFMRFFLQLSFPQKTKAWRKNHEAISGDFYHLHYPEHCLEQPPEDIHHPDHYARGVAVASCQRQSLLGRVKV